MEQQNINRLAHEKSPYLLQHKNNPVDWFPWGQEAFNKAKNEDKPIFLSVGYSTCHWCHVMEHESFENPEIASLMNKVTVPIKVDREERPDVDKIYMSFLQATSGGGGWPMSVWLTPDLKPFFAGTYFPPTSQYGRPGFPDMLRRIDSLWKQSNHRDELIVSADKALQVLRQNFSEKKVTVTDLLEEGSPLLDKVMDTYFQFQVQSYDGVLGGFGKAPKFPRPVIFTGLFHFYSKYKVLKPKESVKALEMCQFTLKQMYKGGIHDHIGGGYHRYSVDKTWHVPHFEKMLYDQSQLASSYLDTYQITKNQIYATAARDILGYVLEKLRSPVKGFYSAEDADSLLKHGGKEHAEGAFYVWEKEEIDTLLGESSPLFCYHYGVLKEGNAPQGTDPHGEFTGKNILIQRHDIGDTASKFGIYADQTLEILEKSRNILKKFRENRPKPFLDDKIITAWNGLMISAFAKAAMVLGDEAYAEAAEGAALFIQRELFKDGHLIRNYREGPSMVKGFADDYAFLITALLDLYENVGNIEWLKWAINLQETMDSLFYDHNSGGYYSIETGDSSLVLRMKEEYDGSEPSPNSYAVHNLVRLYNITQKEKYKEKAKQTLSLYEKELKNSPAIFPHMVAGLDMYFEKLVQITINGHPKDPSTREWLKILGAHYIPHKVVIYNNEAERQSLVELGVENLSNSDSKVDTKVVAQVCKNQTCQIANSPQEFDTLLSK